MMENSSLSAGFKTGLLKLLINQLSFISIWSINQKKSGSPHP